MTLIIDTLPMLTNVIMLCVIVFTVFGIVGVQLWKGLLRNRCFPDLNSTLTISSSASFYQPDEDTDFICGSGMTTCQDIPHYTRCLSSDRNPFNNAISFDNAAYASIAIFQVRLNTFFESIEII